MRTLAARDTFYVTDVHFLTNITSILRHPATRVFEARVDGKLVGFTVTHRYFLRCPFLMVVVCDHRYPGSDALYAKMATYYRDRGAPELGLGFAIDRSLHRYKAKWGDIRAAPPCYQFIWRRNSCNEVFYDCLHWRWRMLIERWMAYADDSFVIGPRTKAADQVSTSDEL
jgi:hypothetical protein